MVLTGWQRIVYKYWYVISKVGAGAWFVEKGTYGLLVKDEARVRQGIGEGNRVGEYEEYIESSSCEMSLLDLNESPRRERLTYR